MARKPRMYCPGVLYHVMLCANGGAGLFAEDPNRQYVERLAAKGFTGLGHRIHAFFWMNNHVHLAIEVSYTPLSKIIQKLVFSYTRTFDEFVVAISGRCRSGLAGE